MSGTQRRGGGAGGERRGRDDRRGPSQQEREKSQYLERVVAINRVAKVVQGGRRFSFTALVVVGDGEGTVGIGYGKAKEVPAAIAKGVEEAKKHFFKVPMIQRTIPHPVQGEPAAGGSASPRWSSSATATARWASATGRPRRCPRRSPRASRRRRRTSSVFPAWATPFRTRSRVKLLPELS